MGHHDALLAQMESGTAPDPAAEAAGREAFWMPFSPNKEFKREPRLFVRAQGMYCYTPDGREVIDASSGLFCVAAGHCRPEIARAVHEQLSSLDFVAPFLRGHKLVLKINLTPKRCNKLAPVLLLLHPNYIKARTPLHPQGTVPHEVSQCPTVVTLQLVSSYRIERATHSHNPPWVVGS